MLMMSPYQKKYDAAFVFSGNEMMPKVCTTRDLNYTHFNERLTSLY